MEEIKKLDLYTYRDMLKVDSLELRDKLRVFLNENGYRKQKGYKFTLKELYELTGTKIESWNNWKNQAIPPHVMILLHLRFDIDLKIFFDTGELKKISREGR